MGDLYADPATGWLLPVPGGVVTQAYGPANTDASVRHLYRKGYHTGIDIAGVAEGTPVFSPTEATVSVAGPNGGYGQCVVIRRDDGTEALFGHLCRITVQTGERVVVGQELGGVGNTGVSTGPHLHYEYRQNGEDIDPTPFIVAAAPGGLRATVKEDLNLRAGPGKDHPVLLTATAGTVVNVGRRGWLPVWHDGREGWMYGAFLDVQAGSVPMDEDASAPVAPPPAAPRTGRTTAAPNLRAGPSTEHAILTTLAPGTAVQVLGEEGFYLRVRTDGWEGFVHRDFVRLDGSAPDGFLRARSALTAVPLEPAPADSIAVSTATDDLGARVTRTWNSFGGLLSVLSTELGVDPGVAVAVLVIESGGRGFGVEGGMVIRFENHIFYDQWGRFQPDLFAQHFSFGAERAWEDHLWRPSPGEPWRAFHGEQAAEWEVFRFACSLDDTAAKRSISMGAPQIMGFNCTAIGCESVQEMFNAFATSAHAQIVGFFDFIRGASGDSPRLTALQHGDFFRFAELYNGTGQAAEYGSLMRSAFDVYRSLRAAPSPAQPIGVA